MWVSVRVLSNPRNSCHRVVLSCLVTVYLGGTAIPVNCLPSCFGAGVTSLNEPPSSCLLSPHYCGLGAGSIPLRAIVNKKQCEMMGLFMLLVITTE